MVLAPRKVNLPAIRYTTFIEAFEAMVAKKQEEIKAMEAGQLEYIACADAIAKVALPNDGRLELTESGGLIKIIANEQDTKRTYDDVAAAIGAKLVERRLHGDGVPAEKHETYWYPEFRYFWHTQRRDGSRGCVKMEVMVPRAGTRDYRVEILTVPSTETSYRLVPRETVLPVT